MIINHKPLLASFFLLFFLYTSNANTNLSEITKNVDELYNKAISNSKTNHELSISLLEQCKSVYKYNNDTAMTIKCIISIGEIHSNNMNLSKSYDAFWEALAIAEKYNNKLFLKQIYENIGRLYSLFRKEKEAKKYYLKSLEINKANYNGDKVTGQDLVSGYYNLVIINNQVEKFDTALMYLDSCFIISNEISQDTIKKGYLYTEKAYILFKNKEYSEAENILTNIKEAFETHDASLYSENNKSYLVIIYSILGDVYLWQKQYNKAIPYYKKGISTIDKYNAHIGMRGDLLYKLSDTYALTGNHKLAHKALLQSKHFNDSIFGTKSIKNSALIEIKNKYREELQQKELEIAQTKAELYEKEKGLFRIKVLLFSALLILVASTLLLRIKKQKKKHLQKSKEDEQIIRNKNKELTSYTLQFIENEKFLSELADYMKKNLPENKRQIEIMEKTKKSRAKHWEDFNTRFLSVNKDFYKKLSKIYPNLTPTELKHCALMKLNFNSKDMAQLLNISVSSVHVSRHRIRKKMELERDENLEKTIAKI